MLEDERIWKKVIAPDYPDAVYHGISHRTFYSERRKLDKLYQFFYSSGNNPSLKEAHQQAGEELAIRLKSLINTGDPFSTLSYVKMLTLSFGDQSQSDADLVAESDCCLELLNTLIEQKYKVNECLGVLNYILSIMSGLAVNEGDNIQKAFLQKP